MITAIVKNGEYETKIRFPCREKELNDSLRRVHLDGEQLAPALMIKKIDPTELSALENEMQSLDALNFLGKRLYGFDELEYHQFLAVLGCEKLEIKWDLKKMVNLTYNLPHYTLIDSTNDLAKVGQIHLLNKLGALPLSETQNKDKMKSIGQRLSAILTMAGVLESVPKWIRSMQFMSRKKALSLRCQCKLKKRKGRDYRN